MKTLLLLVLILAALHQTPVSALTGCKKATEDGIRDFWKIHGTPKLRDSGLMRFAYATRDVSPDTVKCVLASHDLQKQTAPATFYYKDNTKKEFEYKFTATEGILHQTFEDKQYLEYLITDQNDVIAFYKCIPNAPATGPDAAIIAISVGADAKPESQEEINTALSQLTSLGIRDLQVVGTCPEHEKNT